MINKVSMHLKIAVVATFLMFFAQCGFALGIEGGSLPSNQEAEAIPDKLEPEPQTIWSTGTYGPTDADDPSGEITPFGSYLFAGGFRGVRADGLNPNYLIAPGDRITLRIWGSIDVNRVMPVDAQGNVFIPSVGPVKVQGVTHSKLDDTVRRAVQTIYPENVYVYTNLQGVQPVAVFVTGYVKTPGRYAGTPNDSILYFLDQAGGVDSKLGSYRKIRIIRHGKTIAHVDLYDFLLSGSLTRIQFRDGDTVIVEERGLKVTVVGDVERTHHYELHSNELQSGALLKLARLRADVSHVLLRGVRSTGPISAYYPLADFSSAVLHDGDEVLFSADQRDKSIVVQLEGSFFGPSRYVLPKDAMLHELLDAVEVPESLTDVSSISIRRLSIAERQKKSLTESLRRLETTYLGAPSSTPDEAQIRVREAELINNFVERVSKIQPTGRLVVSQNGNIFNTRLQDGDVITIPERSDSLLVSGEVLMAQSLVYSPRMEAMDYIQKSGGFTQHADKERILVVHQSGEVSEATGAKLKPGDEILLFISSVLVSIIYNLSVL